MSKKRPLIAAAIASALFSGTAMTDGHSVADDVIAAQRSALAATTEGAGFGQ